MPRLLWIESSPMKARSFSGRAGNTFFEVLARAWGSECVDRLNVFEEQLPELNGQALEANLKLQESEPLTCEEERAFAPFRSCIERFTAADLYLFTVPMWNLGIPYRLKHYLDVITQPGYLWKLNEKEELVGLLEGKRAVVICARGAEFGPGSPLSRLDYQSPFLEAALNFVGITDIRTVIMEPTAGPTAGTVLAGGMTQAGEMAEDLLRT